MPRRPVAHTRPTGSAFFLRCLTFLSLLIIGIPTSSSAFGELPAKRLEVAEVETPFRFLLIPVKGLVGVNVTSGGVDEAINLAKSQGWEGVIFELDATMGLLDEGLAIAGRIRQAAADLRTIALVRRVGGAGIPILFACEEWLVFDKIDIEVYR